MLKHAENAARFGKIPSLTPFAKDMGFIEFYNIDLIIYSVSFTLFAIYVTIEIFGIVKNCCKTRKLKNE